MPHSLLGHEANIMSYLRSPALPLVTALGYSSQHNILVMELMGKSLEDIFEEFTYRLGIGPIPIPHLHNFIDFNYSNNYKNIV